MKWIETTKEAYSAISMHHRDELTVFGSFSNPEESSRFGKPEMMTEWGFKNSDFPIIKSVATKESDDQKEWDWKFYVAVYSREDMKDD